MINKSAPVPTQGERRPTFRPVCRCDDPKIEPFPDEGGSEVDEEDSEVDEEDSDSEVDDSDDSDYAPEPDDE